MGILAENLQWLLNRIPPASDCGPMLELGNQFLYITEAPVPDYPEQFLNPTMCAPVVAKGFFLHRGFRHESVDINGQDGAQQLDLATPVEIARGPFQVVTDFGTSEHVPCLWQCLKNIHEVTLPGSLIFHVNPLTGNWPGHGHWYRDEAFYKAYAELTGYKILDLRRDFACGNNHDGWNIWCELERDFAPFPSKEDFYTLPLHKS